MVTEWESEGEAASVADEPGWDAKQFVAPAGERALDRPCRCKVSACRSIKRFPADSAAPIQTRFTLCPGRRRPRGLHTSRSLRANPARLRQVPHSRTSAGLRHDRPAVRMADENDSAVQGSRMARTGLTAVQVSEESPVEPVSGQVDSPGRDTSAASPASTGPSINAVPYPW